MPKDRDITKILSQCTHFAMGSGVISPQDELKQLAELAGDDQRADAYGSGKLIENLEQRIAEILGKPAAVFMPSGTMAQQIVLRIWSQRQNNPRVVFHPTCHLEVHERRAYRLLHGLDGILAGNPYGLITLADLKAIDESFGMLLLELPQREIGGLLPEWTDLKAITGWARENGIITHMDGARLWQCRPYYQQSYAEIAALFDTVYVSFYKVLNGIAGAALAGPEDVIAEARVWQRRHGGNLIRMYPYLLSTQYGLDHYLPKMEAYHQKAVELAEHLSQIPDIEVKPNPPQTNMMHLFVRGEAEALNNAVLDIAEEKQIFLARQFVPTQIPAYQKTELSVGDATLELETAEWVSLYEDLIARSR